MRGFLDNHPFYSRLDTMGAFADSRDGQQEVLRQRVTDQFGARLQDAGRDMMPPIGNTVDPSRLVPYSAQLSEDMTPDEQRRIPHAIFNPAIYADMVQLLVPLLSGTETLAVPRPKNTRIFLLIQNTNLANLYVAFDQVANTAGLLIPPSGTAFFDTAVPQNDIHLFYGAAVDTVIPIFYMNADLSRAVG